MLFVVVLLVMLELAHKSYQMIFDGHIVGGLAVLALLAGVVWLFLHMLRGFNRPAGVWLIRCFALGIVGIGLFTVVGDVATRNTEIYRNAIGKLHTSKEAESSFGNRLKTGWPIKVSGEWGADAQHTELVIPISGARANGNLYVNGIKADGQWRIVDLYALRDGSGSKIEIQH